MISPTRQLILATFAGLPIAMLALPWPKLWLLWVLYIAALVCASGVDLLLALPKRRLSLEATLEPILYLGEPVSAQLKLRAKAWRATSAAQLKLDVEGEVEEPAPLSLRFDGQGLASASLELTPQRRGQLRITHAHVRWAGPLGLFTRSASYELALTSSIIPNIVAVRRAALRLATHHTFISGAKQRRYIGDGSEFESLREYMPGLDIRGIDWRASAKHRKVLCRENRSERNHRIILAIDTGYLMRTSIDGIPRQDHAINAGLLLAYMSLKTGDQVGLYAFDQKMRAFCEPSPSVKHIQRLQQLCATLDYSTHETNFTLGMTDLASRLRRRSVIVVMTDFSDSVSAELMVENLQWMARRHLILFVAIRDAALERLSLISPESLLDTNRAVVAADVLKEREVVLERLRRQGIFCIDATPATLSVELINRYLEIHRRELV